MSKMRLGICTWSLSYVSWCWMTFCPVLSCACCLEGECLNNSARKGLYPQNYVNNITLHKYTSGYILEPHCLWPVSLGHVCGCSEIPPSAARGRQTVDIKHHIQHPELQYSGLHGWHPVSSFGRAALVSEWHWHQPPWLWPRRVSQANRAAKEHTSYLSVVT